MKAVLIISGIIGSLAVAGYYEVMLWNECLKDHSTLYCFRVLSH